MFSRIIFTLPVLFPVLFRNPVYLIRRPPEGNFPQGRKIIQGKKMIHRRAGLLRTVYLPLLQPFQKIRRLNIHKLHLIRLIENKVRDPFLYSDSCYGSHDIIQAFQMLHIDRGIYADSFLQQLLNILITLGMAAAGRIRMGKLIHQQQLRPSLKRRIQIEFPQYYIFIWDFQNGKLLQSVQKRHGFRTRMGFNIPGSHVYPRFCHLCGRLQHRIGFSHSCCISEKYF